jgi:tetrahydromethanopterin S-methyltransferase subunit B
MAWLGIKAAAGTGFHPVYGLMVGLMVASLLSSAMFTTWLFRALKRLQ